MYTDKNDDDETKDVSVFFYINMGLSFMTMFMALGLILLTMFRWNRRDLFVQGTLWAFFLGLVLGSSVAILEVDEGIYYNTEVFLALLGRDLVFAGHLILVLQYLYTSLIMPKILLESELKLNMESGERIVEPTFGVYETAEEAFNRQVKNIKRFQKVCKFAIITFGVIAWVSFTSADLYLASSHMNKKK